MLRHTASNTSERQVDQVRRLRRNASQCVAMRQLICPLARIVDRVSRMADCCASEPTEEFVACVNLLVKRNSSKRFTGVRRPNGPKKSKI